MEEARSDRSLTRSSLVSQVIRDAETAPLVVPGDPPVTKLPELVAANRKCRTVAVVDNSGVLLGVIPAAVIGQRLLFQMMPEELLGDILEPEKAAELARERHARTAQELMNPPRFISANATVGEAIHLLHHTGLECLPVVDEQRHVIGCFDLLETMVSWWQNLRPNDGGS